MSCLSEEHAAKSWMPEAGLISLESCIVTYFKSVHHIEGTFKNIQISVINHNLCWEGAGGRNLPELTNS